eukprot:32196-Alexandrium_andersonii.AAC.1
MSSVGQKCLKLRRRWSKSAVQRLLSPNVVQKCLSTAPNVGQKMPTTAMGGLKAPNVGCKCPKLRRRWPSALKTAGLPLPKSVVYVSRCASGAARGCFAEFEA